MSIDTATGRVNGSAPSAPRPPAAAPAARATAWQRVAAFADDGSFQEFGSRAHPRQTAFGTAGHRPGDGVVSGVARVGGRPVALYAQEPGVLGGSLGEVHARKIARLLTRAERARTPVVGLIHSGGARIQEGVSALDGYGEIFRGNVRLSGRVPQVSVVLGPCAGGAVYSPALTDIVIMDAAEAYMFLTGPRVVKTATFEDVSPVELGGAQVHARQSGVAHLVADDAAHALDLARRVLSYLPSSCWEPPPAVPAAAPESMPVVPLDPRVAYDVRGVVRGIADAGSFLELQPRFARNVVTGFGRVSGRPVGFVANQPNALAGVLDIAAAEKAARFVRLCDAFGLALVTLVDTPGFLPGPRQESGGVIRKGAKLLYAFAEATVPRVTVVLRKAYGGAYIVMNSRSLGADAVYAWPAVQLGVLGDEGAVDIIYRRELAAEPGRREELAARYRDEATSGAVAAGRLAVDEIIEPERTRAVVADTLCSLAGAARTGFRHDNLPQ